MNRLMAFNEFKVVRPPCVYGRTWLLFSGSFGSLKESSLQSSGSMLKMLAGDLKLLYLHVNSHMESLSNSSRTLQIWVMYPCNLIFLLADVFLPILDVLSGTTDAHNFLCFWSKDTVKFLTIVANTNPLIPENHLVLPTAVSQSKIGLP